VFSILFIRPATQLEPLAQAWGIGSTTFNFEQTANYNFDNTQLFSHEVRSCRWDAVAY
jgi:hypothetical protein